MKEQEQKNIEELLSLINQYTYKLIAPTRAPENIVKDILKGHIRDFYERIDQLDLFIPSVPSDDKQEPEQDITPVIEAKEEEPPEPIAEESNEKEQESIEEMKKSLENLRKKFEKMESPEQETPDTESKKHVEEPIAEQVAPDKEVETQEQEPQKTVHETEKVPDSEDNTEKKSEKPKPAEQPKHKKVIGDQYHDDKNSLNDFLSLKNGNHSIGERLKRHQIHDLKKAIDINHKFLFIRELFDGNSQEYNQTIERLNEAKSIEEAAKILDEFRGKHNWNEKEEALNIFNELIHRKF